MQLSEKEKYKIIVLDEEGHTQSEIARKTGVNQSIVSRTLKKYKNFDSVIHMGGNGRNTVMTADVVKVIMHEKKKKPSTSLRKLSATVYDKLGKQINHNSIKNWFNKHNIFAFNPISKPLLNKRQITCRFNIAKKCLFMPENEIKSIIFSDESKFNLFYSDGKVSVWREPGTGLKSENLIKTVKHGGASVNVWGCFSYHGVGRLEFIDGIMDAPYYVDILSRNLSSSAALLGMQKYTFQQDNDPKHTAKLTQAFFDDQEIEVMDWPPHSPDLNPIEHLWALIKIKVAERQPKNLSDLKSIIFDEWNKIPVDLCRKLALSFKKRALAIYKAKGEHINY